MNNDARKNIVGVKGLLWLLCFSLIVASPIINIIGIVLNYIKMKDLLNVFGRYKGFTIISSLMWVILSGYGFSIGKDLYEVRPNAVKRVKILFGFLLAGRVADIILILFSGLPGEARSAMIIFEEIPRIFYTAASICFWFLYLTYSKRVKNTYTV
jgi:hypothetical protein